MRKSTGEGRAFNSRKRKDHATIMRMSIALGTLSVGLILCICVFWAFRQSKVRGKTQPIRITHAEVSHDMLANPMPETEAMEYIHTALSSTTEDEIGKYFHLGTSSAADALSFLTAHMTTPPEDCHSLWMGPILTDGIAVEVGMIDLGSSTDSDPRLIMLRPGPESRWLVDYEAFARVTTPSWDEILSNPHEGGIVRITISLEHYYNGPFNEREWSCYRLHSLDLDRTIYAYCRRGSATSKAIVSFSNKSIFTGGESKYKMASNLRATLEIKAPEDALPNQFEITRVIAEDWIARDTIYEDQF